MKIKNIKQNFILNGIKDFKLLAKRPKYSKLDSYKLQESIKEKIPHWKIGIDRFLEELKGDI